MVLRLPSPLSDGLERRTPMRHCWLLQGTEVVFNDDEVPVDVSHLVAVAQGGVFVDLAIEATRLGAREVARLVHHRKPTLILDLADLDLVKAVLVVLIL